MNSEEVSAILRKHSMGLGEQFENVRILVSFNEEGETKMMHDGCGNWYCSTGMARAFLLRDEIEERRHGAGDA